MGLWRSLWRYLRRRPDDEWGRTETPGPAYAWGPPSPGYQPRSYDRPRPRRKPWMSFTLRALAVVLVVFGLLGFVLYRADRAFRPSLAAIGEMKARAMASQAMNEALSQDVFADVRYDQLMDVKMDPDGRRILLIQANAPELARVAGRAQQQVWAKLQELNGQPIRIPLGQVFGWTLFGNWGPTIPVSFHPVGAAITDIRQVFQSGGINQTQHIIYAHTEVTIRVLVPLVSRDVAVSTNTFITAAVLNGEVPSVYLSGGAPGQALPPVLVPGRPFDPQSAVSPAPALP